MIELIEGVPGSGKSFYAVKERFLRWVRANRRVYIYVDGIYLDRLAHFEGRALAELEPQITVWRTAQEVMAQLPTIAPRSAVLIDEAQTVFRAMQRVDPALLRWLETHRHYGVDVVLMCQSYLQMSTGVTRLVESTTKFRKLSFVGLPTRTQGKVRGNPEETEVIRTFVLRFDAKTYSYYASYAEAAITEQRLANSVFMSPRVLIGIVAACFVGVVLLMHPWTSLGSGSPGTTREARSGGPAAPAGGMPGASTVPVVGPEPPAPPRPVPRVVIQGATSWADGPDRRVKYVLATGEILTAEQIAVRYRVAVTEAWVNGVPSLTGEGIAYGSGGE